MPVAAVLVTLGAAALHALWNQLLAHGGDTRPRMAVAMLVGAVAFLPVALIDVRFEPVAWVFVAASVAFELTYSALLAAAYDRAPMGVVYPVARGAAPVIVLLVSATALGERVSVLRIAGILLVVGGIVLVRGVRGRTRPRDLGLALAVGGCIAGYTLVDATGVQHASPAAYIEVVFATAAVLYTGVVARSVGATALRSALDRRTAVVGLGVIGAYALVLVALTLAPAPAVAAVRETSVVLAVLALAVTGKERITVAQLIGAVLVSAGIAGVVAG